MQNSIGITVTFPIGSARNDKSKVANNIAVTWGIRMPSALGPAAVGNTNTFQAKPSCPCYNYYITFESQSNTHRVAQWSH